MANIVTDIDYGEAFKVAGGGFGTTFLILVILTLCTYVLRLISKIAAKKKQAGANENSEE